MAKVIFGAFVTGIRGKIGGTTFSGNGSGASVGKTKTTAKKAGPKKMLQSAAVGGISRGWRSLAEADRLQFISDRVNYPRTNSLGQTYYLSGFQLFMSRSAQLKAIGIPALTEFVNPLLPDNSINEITLNSITLSLATGFTFDYEDSEVNENTYLKVFASARSSAGKSTISGAYKMIYNFQSTVDPAIVPYSAYNDVFGPLAVGDVIFLKVTLINSVSGIEVNLTNDYKVTVVA